MTFLTTRGMLAKLLATENLVVQHDPSASTAAFNTDTRVLKLPVLKTESEHIYNLFIAHEASHALHTPTDWADHVPSDVPFDFVNVVEDIRIEKLIQETYPGLRVDFSKGYDELDQDNFFGIADKDLSKMSFIDRLNLNAKLGSRALIPFSPEEQTYVKAADDADTFDKVLLVAKMIAAFVKSKKEDKTEEVDSDNEQPNSQKQDGEGNDTTQGNKDNSGENEEQESTEPGESFDQQPDETVSETQRQMDENLKDLADSSDAHRNQIAYVNIPQVKYSELVVDIETYRTGNNGEVDEFLYGKFQDFLSQSKRDVTLMHQRFEMKKSADAFARQQENKTGVLNTNALHAYKISDDIFLRSQVTPDGKNHGMVMFLDWSGSMTDHLISTIKQLIILVQFCRKAQIPFDVYTFTSGHKDEDYVVNNAVHHIFNVVQVLTSTSSKSEIDSDLFHLFANAHFNLYYSSSNMLRNLWLSMGGTPLDNVMLFTPQIIKNFRERTNTQKVSLVFVTDGESSPIQYYGEYKGYNGDIRTTTKTAYYETILIRDGIEIHPIKQPNATGQLSKWLENKIPDCTITNIFLGTLSTSARHTRHNGFIMDESVFRKESGVAVRTKFWPLIVCLNPNSFKDADDEIEIQGGASKAQIRSALKKMLKSKQSSKRILTTLADQFS